MRKALASGARVAGFDGERAMLACAPRGLGVQAELGRAPFQADAFDLVVAAFSLSYADEPAGALADLRDLVVPGGRLVVVDLHPDAVDAGWRRTFQAEGRTIEIPSRVQALEAALMLAVAGWRTETLDSFRFGEEERALFDAEHWMQVCRVWAVRFAIWRKL
jgi:SAM-dependent methyltransferase